MIVTTFTAGQQSTLPIWMLTELVRPRQRPVTNVVAVFVIAVIINIGMWLERILIVWNTLSHDYLPSSWRLFLPTTWDWLITFGSLGLFALMFLVFVRLLPSVSMHEVRHLVAEEVES